MKTDLYPSLNTCKKIAHLFDGTELYWYKYDDGSGYIASDGSLDKFGAEICKCPNIVELLDRFPSCLYIYKKLDKSFSARISGSRSKRITNIEVCNKSLPEALGLLLHKLDKEGLLK